MKRVIDLLSETKDAEKCMNIAKDILRVLIEGFGYINYVFFISLFIFLLLCLSRNLFRPEVKTN